MKIFITGISGLMGLNLAIHTQSSYDIKGSYYSHPVLIPNISTVKMNLDPLDMKTIISDSKADVVINTIALTDIEFCERNPDIAHSINVTAAENIAKITNTMGAKLVHISSDHIFNGSTPWNTEDTTAMPVNVYAKTKLSAEEAVINSCPNSLVIRTNFYGIGTSIRESFSDWIIRGLSSGSSLSMFDDVYFTPILINDLVDLLLRLITNEASGIYHIAGSDRISKYDFAVILSEIFQLEHSYIKPSSIDSIDHLVKRPKDMSLSSRKTEQAIGIPMPDIKSGISRLLEMHQTDYKKTLESSIVQK